MKEFIAGLTELPGIQEQITDVAGYLWEKGWAESNAGNLSYNITEIVDGIPMGFDFGELQPLQSRYGHLADHLILLTATGSRMRNVHKSVYENSCLVLLNAEGTGYRQLLKPGLESKLKPTSELPSHLAIHNMLVGENRKEKAVVHTHPRYIIALTHIREFCDQERINNMLWGIQPETCVFVHDGIGFIPYLLTGSEAIADATLDALKDHRVLLWEKHGCLAIGETLYDAFDLIDIVEKSISIFFTCKNAGYDMEGISLENLRQLRGHFNLE